MTDIEFYELASGLLTQISDNLIQIISISQAVLILICGIIIYQLFWGGGRR